MNKKLIIFILFIGSCVFAQKSVDTPYSFYGLGQIRQSSSIESRLMGGVTTYLDSARVNLKNPAFYGGLKYTSFSMGGSFSRADLSVSGASSGVTNNVSFDYLVLGLPIIDKLSVGLGVAPYTSVGYKTSFYQKEDHQDVLYRYQGKGDVSQIFFSTGYNILKGLYVGVSADFNFGSTQKDHFRMVQYEQLSVQEQTISYMKGLSYKIGLAYKTQFQKRWFFMGETSFSPSSRLKVSNSQSVSTLEASANTGELIVKQTYDNDLKDLSETSLIKPWQWLVGFSAGEDKKWMVALNYETSGFSQFNNPMVHSSDVKYQNTHRLMLGGFYIPKYNSFTRYLDRVTYRVGGFYQKGAIVLKNHSIDDFGISFGVTLPVVGLSDFTLGAICGRRGSINSDLLNENYWKINIGFSLNDKWFQRSKIK